MESKKRFDKKEPPRGPIYGTKEEIDRLLLSFPGRFEVYHFDLNDWETNAWRKGRYENRA